MNFTFFVLISLWEVKMKSFQSKFSRKKSGTESSSKPSSSSVSGCCCGSKYADDFDEVEIIEEEEK